MKEIKINGMELQIGKRIIKLSVEEIHELKRILLEAFPEPYPTVYIPSIWIYDNIPQPQYVTTVWNTTAGEVHLPALNS
jgi:hypothetical protein